MKAPAIVRLLDAMGLGVYRLSLTEAHRLGCCVRCRRDVNTRDWSARDQDEWALSGLCPTCYAALWDEREVDCE